ncbi:hypothetical protein [Glaciimonas sp. GG7]
MSKLIIKQPLSALKISQIFLLLGIFATIALLDFYTGYQTSIFSMYAFPVVLTVWFFNGAMGMLAVVLAVALWLMTYLLDGGPVRGTDLALTLINRGTLLSFVVFSIVQTRRAGEAKHRAILDIVKNLTICSGCSHVSDDKQIWEPTPDYIERRTGIRANVAYCTQCARRHYANAHTCNRSVSK